MLHAAVVVRVGGTRTQLPEQIPHVEASADGKPHCHDHRAAEDKPRPAVPIGQPRLVGDADRDIVDRDHDEDDCPDERPAQRDVGHRAIAACEVLAEAELLPERAGVLPGRSGLARDGVLAAVQQAVHVVHAARAEQRNRDVDHHRHHNRHKAHLLPGQLQTEEIRHGRDVGQPRVVHSGPQRLPGNLQYDHAHKRRDHTSEHRGPRRRRRSAAPVQAADDHRAGSADEYGGGQGAEHEDELRVVEQQADEEDEDRHR